MSQTPPTGSSGPAKSQKVERTPKIRLSCDACAVAKVKCSQHRPECERCTANKLECLYRPSQRYGKPPRDKAKRGTVSQQHSNSSSVTAESTSELFDFQNPAGHEQSTETGFPGFQGFETNNAFGSDQIWPFMHPDSGSSVQNPFLANYSHAGSDTLSMSFPTNLITSANLNDSSAGQYPPSPESYRVPSNIQANDQQHSGSGSFSPTTQQVWDLQQLLTNNAVLSEPAPNSVGSMNPEWQEPRPSVRPLKSCSDQECYALACWTLASLRSEQSGTSTPSIAGMPSRTPASLELDSILARNKTAIQNILQLLDCTCANQPHMALLYASITSKILIWYKLAAGIQVASSSHTEIVNQVSTSKFLSSIGANTRPANCSSIPSTIIRNNIKVGSFSPDEEDQAPMRYFLLLSELGKAGVLIDSLLAMQNNSGSDRPGAAEDVGDEDASGSHYATLAGWLKIELARVTAAVKTRLMTLAPELGSGAEVRGGPSSSSSS